MTAEDVREYARRSWATVADWKADYWVEQYRMHGAAPAQRAAAALLQHVRSVQPDYPSGAQREADLAAHDVLRHRLDRAAHAFSGR